MSLRPFSSRASIVKSCSKTNKNRATLAHSDLISVQCLGVIEETVKEDAVI